MEFKILRAEVAPLRKLWLCLLACSAWLWKRSGESSKARSGTRQPSSISSFAMVTDYMAGRTSRVSSLSSLTGTALTETCTASELRQATVICHSAELLQEPACAAAVIYLHQIHPRSRPTASPRFTSIAIRNSRKASDVRSENASSPFLHSCHKYAAARLTASASPSKRHPSRLARSIIASENLSSHLSTADVALGLALFALTRGPSPSLAGIRHTQFFNTLRRLSAPYGFRDCSPPGA